MTYDANIAIKELAERFYSGRDYASALEILQKHGRAMAPQNIKILDDLLTERRELLDPAEPFFDESQLIAAIHYSYGAEKFRTAFSGHSGQRDGLLERVANRISIEGFVESNDHEPREAE